MRCVLYRRNAAIKHLKCRANPFRSAVEMWMTNSNNHSLPLGVVLSLYWWPSTSAPWREWRVMAARRHGNWGPRNTSSTYELQGTSRTSNARRTTLYFGFDINSMLHISFEYVHVNTAVPVQNRPFAHIAVYSYFKNGSLKQLHNQHCTSLGPQQYGWTVCRENRRTDLHTYIQTNT